MDSNLITTDGINRAIARTKTPEDVVDLHSKLDALVKYYGRKTKEGLICLWGSYNAGRRGGQLLKQDPRLGQKGRGGNRYKKVQNSSGMSSVLSEIGLTYNQSAYWQLWSNIPDDVWQEKKKKSFDTLTWPTKKELTALGKKFRRKQQRQQEINHVIELAKELPETDSEDCLYKDDSTQAWVGDATNLYFIDDNSVDLIITSPPYNIGQKSGNGRVLWRGVEYSDVDDQIPEGEYQDSQINVLNELWRVTRPGGSLFYNHKIRNRKGQGIHPLIWITQSQWIFRQQIIWDRGSTHNKEMSYFWPHDELIFWLTKGTDGVYLSPEGARMSTVWRFNFETNTDHPAPFPSTLPVRCIRAASKEGDLILDPFAGSFTTCLAAKKLNRRSIGVDISKTYVAKFSLRLSQLVLKEED